MSTAKLREPSQPLAMKVLTEVDFEHRLNGFILRQRAGAVPVTMYSFEEVVSLLHDHHSRLDFKQLEEWIRSVMSDTELAKHIAQAIRKGNNDQERAASIRNLMEERLNQCRREDYHEKGIV
jgi:hypothetical protein